MGMRTYGGSNVRVTCNPKVKCSQFACSKKLTKDTLLSSLSLSLSIFSAFSNNLFCLFFWSKINTNQQQQTTNSNSDNNNTMPG
mmetsp:Transcript_17977/g.20610  ORF Transcript_17977/g.20610 Transcript_17977/m.20610 type:complete len:84 (+) Transcript_17977:266-517(+)